MPSLLRKAYVAYVAHSNPIVCTQISSHVLRLAEPVISSFQVQCFLANHVHRRDQWSCAGGERGALELWPEFNLRAGQTTSYAQQREKFSSPLMASFRFKFQCQILSFSSAARMAERAGAFCCFQLFPLYFAFKSAAHLKTRPILNRFLRLNWCLCCILNFFRDLSVLLSCANLIGEIVNEPLSARIANSATVTCSTRQFGNQQYSSHSFRFGTR